MISFRTFAAIFALSAISACGAGDTEKSVEKEAPAPANVEQADNIEEKAWPPTAEEEELYRQRFKVLVESYAAGEPTTTYDTLGPLRGAETEIEFPVSDEGLGSETKNLVDSYADVNNSQALIVLKGGSIIHEAYFNDADENTLIVGKSLAKPLGGIAVGAAIHAGKIKSLDEPVATYITEWKGTDKENILIRHLLDMRSGLLPQAQASDEQNVLNRAYLHPRHDGVIINEYPLVGVPGERYDYSNANAELIAPLIERATGIEYEDWIADEVLTPLGALGGEVWMNRPGGTAHAGCCILLPAKSWLKVANLVMQDGVVNGTRLLPEGFVEEMKTPTPQNSHAAMGIYVGHPYLEYRGFLNPEMEFGKSFHSEPYADPELFLFDGNSNQVVYFMPTKDLIVLRVGNTPPREPVWDNAYLPNTIYRGISSN